LQTGIVRVALLIFKEVIGLSNGLA